jgi:DNA-binding CsgD family transcriptional regulator
MASRLNVTGVVCLLGASVGSLVQYLVSPISAGDSASAQVAAAAVHPTRMAWAAVPDLPILPLIPALVYVAWLAGARSSWLAAVGTGLTFATALSGVGYLLALDPLLYAAARQPQRGPAADLVAGYLGAGVFLHVATGGYLYAQAAFAPGSHLPGAALAGWLDGWPWVAAIAVVPTVGLLLFPTGRPPSARWRPVLWAGYLVLAALTASTLFGRGLLDFPDRRNPTALPGVGGSLAQILGMAVGFVAPLGTVGAWSVHRRRHRIMDPRQARAVTLVEPAAWLIAAGQSNAAIAARLGLSEKTVRNNVSNIFAKLRVADRSAAIVRAPEAGLG